MWLQTFTSMGTQIWPAAGVALAGILIWGASIWPAIFFGTLAVHLINGDSILLFIGPAIGNTIEPIIGAQFCTRGPNFHHSLAHPQDIIRFLMGALLIGTICGTFIGASWIWIFGNHQIDFHYFIQYWSGDSMGILMLSPLILVLSTANKNPQFGWKSIKKLELATLILIVVAASALYVPQEEKTRLYLFFPLMLWTALCLGQRGVTISTFFITILLVWESATGHGPFSDYGSHIKSDFDLTFFIATLQLTGLIVASVVMEREEQKFIKEQNTKRAHGELQVINRELEKSLQYREEFLSIASHELKTPMTPLKLNFQIFKKVIEKVSLPPETHEIVLKCIAVCDRALTRLDRLTEELLLGTRIHAGKLVMNLEKVNFSKLIQEVIEQYHYELDKSGSAIELHLDHSIEGVWDRMKIEEVLVNLITNAIKFSSGRLIEIWLDQESGNAKLVVRDHGIGIEIEDQKRIFQRFERAVSTKHYGGLGLGLYITRQIVEAHGGRIELKSELGKGATFTVFLPQKSNLISQKNQDSLDNL